MTRVDLITGFLGAGKTTFIKKYASYLKNNNLKCIVIENEFGMAGVDAQILERNDIKVTQLVGGCICCTQKVNFHNKIIELSKEGYDNIIVEPSGIYNADEFFTILNSPTMNGICTIGFVATIVDPNQIDNMSQSVKDLEKSQLGHSGAIIVSKTNDLEETRLISIKDRLIHLIEKTNNKKAKIFVGDWDKFSDEDYRNIINCGYNNTLRQIPKMDHSKMFQSATLYPNIQNIKDIDEKLKTIMDGSCGNILRIKGNIKDINENIYTINISSGFYKIEKSEGKLGINVIGLNVNRKRILEILS